jgi:hypothetical protein
MKETLKLINQMVKDRVIEAYAIGGAIGAIYYLYNAGHGTAKRLFAAQHVLGTRQG